MSMEKHVFRYVLFLHACCLSLKRPVTYTEDGCIWTQYNNTGVYHGTEDLQSNSIAECQKNCWKTACKAIDWNPNGYRHCWTLNFEGQNVFRNGITHYDLTCPSGPYQENYVGCYQISNQFVETKSNMTAEACIGTCRRLNSTYAGLQNGKDCSCFDHFNASRQLSDACNVQCNGNQSEFCGGRNGSNSIYTVCTAGFYGFGCDFSCHCERKIPCHRMTGECPNKRCEGRWTGSACDMSSLSETYIGCYEDHDGNRLLEYQADNSNSKDYEIATTDYTTETCSFICTDRRYSYFGLEFMGQCFCGSSYSKYGPINDNFCNTSCTGNSLEICGGAQAISLYSVCPAGYYGKDCHINCNCRNNSRCDYSSGACPSGCKTGWMGQNSLCNVRNCNENNGGCSVNESCVQINLKYSSVNRCICASGYQRKWLWDDCTDIDECSISESMCNVSTSKCINSVGSYRCKCNEGYKSANDTLCTDMNECTEDEAKCDNSSSTCINTYGSYICLCRDGYETLGSNICTDKNECQNHEANCSILSTDCHNKPGGYDCVCKEGFTRQNISICTVIQSYNPAGVIAGAVVGAFAGVVLILLLIFLIMYFCRRSKSLKESDSTDQVQAKITPKAALVNRAVTIYAGPRDLPQMLRDKISDQETMKNEIQAVPLETKEFSELGNNIELAKKNRFKNIIPYEFNRVILSTQPGEFSTEYINASYIESYNSSDKFIATQGPREETLEDFWRMVLEKDANLIVMITNCIEGPKRKCEKYWPDIGKSVSFGDIKVTLKQEDFWPDYIMRRIQASKAKRSVEVTQMHYLDWPDHAVPNDVKGFLAFRDKVRRLMLPDRYTVVHCSAGAGRTGTFIAIDYLIEQEKAEHNVDIFGCLKQMRDQRAAMIQNVRQYKFVHSSLLMAFTIGQTAIPVETFTSRFKELQKKNRVSGQSTIDMQFKSIEETKFDLEEKAKYQVCSNSLDQEKLANMDAIYVSSWKCKDAYISLNLGKATTDFTDFWRLREDQNSTVIIFIDPTQGSEASFLPTKDKPISLGDSKLLLNMVVSEEYGTRYQLTEVKDLENAYENTKPLAIYENSEITSEGKGITVIHVTESLAKSSECTNHLMSVYETVKSFRKSKDSSPVIVVCRNDCSLNGFCLAAFNAFDMLTFEKEIDVYQIVLNIRKSKPELISSDSIYFLLHEVIERYIAMNLNTYEMPS